MKIWNSADKNANISLADSDRTAVADTTAWKSIRSFGKKDTGKWYFECSYPVVAAGHNMTGILHPDRALSTHIGGYADGWAYNGQDGFKWNNGSQVAYGESVQSGEILGVAVDLDAGKIWWAVDNVWQGSGDPVAGTGEAWSNVVGPVLPAASPYQITNEISIAADVTWCSYSPPSGFSYWDDLDSGEIIVQSPEILIASLISSDTQIGFSSVKPSVTVTKTIGSVSTGIFITSPEIILSLSISSITQIFIPQPESQVNCQASSNIQIQLLSPETLITIDHSIGEVFAGVVIQSVEAILTPSISSDLQVILSQPEIQANVIADSDIQLQLSSPESQVTTSTSIDEVFIGILLPLPEILLQLAASSDVSLVIASPEIISTVDIVTNASILFASIEAIVNTTITTAEVPVVTFTTEHASIYYLLTVTGDGDDTSDIEIPISSFQARLRAFAQNYLSVVIPGLEYSSEISARSHGDIIIDVAYKMGEELLIREQLIRVNLEDIRIDPGPRSQSITLSGHKQRIFTESKDVTITEPPIYYNLINGKLRYRFLNPHLNLEVWDYVTVGTDVFRVRTITYSVGALSRQMELSESD